MRKPPKDNQLGLHDKEWLVLDKLAKWSSKHLSTRNPVEAMMSLGCPRSASRIAYNTIFNHNIGVV